jgi:hypothetical protein
MFVFLSCHNTIIELNLVSHDALETHKVFKNNWRQMEMTKKIIDYNYEQM